MNKCKNIARLLLGIGVLFITSCKVMYIPNMENVPLLKEKGEIHSTINPRNFQFSYAASDHVGIMATGYYRNSTWEAPNIFLDDIRYKVESKRLSGELGGGYFTGIGENGVFECYGGGGIGSLEYNVSTFNDGRLTEQNLLNSETIKAFAQPAIGLRTNNVNIAFSTRMVGMQFFNIQTKNYSTSLLKSEDIYQLDDPIWWFVEPAITFRAGFKYVKLHSQVLLSLKLNEEPLNYIPLSLNFGVHINLSEQLFQKVTDKEE